MLSAWSISWSVIWAGFGGVHSWAVPLYPLTTLEENILPEGDKNQAILRVDTVLKDKLQGWFGLLIAKAKGSQVWS